MFLYILKENNCHKLIATTLIEKTMLELEKELFGHDFEICFKTENKNAVIIKKYIECKYIQNMNNFLLYDISTNNIKNMIDKYILTES
jgi:hypothetical protein